MNYRKYLAQKLIDDTPQITQQWIEAIIVDDAIASSIKLKSELNVGSVFTVILPIA